VIEFKLILSWHITENRRRSQDHRGLEKWQVKQVKRAVYKAPISRTPQHSVPPRD